MSLTITTNTAIIDFMAIPLSYYYPLHHTTIATIVEIFATPLSLLSYHQYHYCLHHTATIIIITILIILLSLSSLVPLLLYLFKTVWFTNSDYLHQSFLKRWKYYYLYTNCITRMPIQISKVQVTPGCIVYNYINIILIY